LGREEARGRLRVSFSYQHTPLFAQNVGVTAVDVCVEFGASDGFFKGRHYLFDSENTTTVEAHEMRVVIRGKFDGH